MYQAVITAVKKKHDKEMECVLFYIVCENLSDKIFEQGPEGSEEASSKGI